MLIVYYSSGSEYTHRFVEKLGLPAVRLPLLTKDDTPLVSEPFVLITPTYGAGRNAGSTPRQVIKFLNVKENRDKIVGVIGSGNTNFGNNFCRAAYTVAEKTKVPVLYNFEMFGTQEDVEKVKEGLEKLCQQQPQNAI